MAIRGRIPVELKGLDAELRRHRAMQKQIDKAVREAVSVSTHKLHAGVESGFAKAIGATESAVKERKRITARITRAKGLVWIGLQPFLPTHLGGNVSQSATGVTVGNHSFVGAFHKAIYTQDKKVWIRLRSRHYDAALYPYKGRNTGSVDGKLNHRFPVVLGRIRVDTDAVRDLINHEADQAGDLLADLVTKALTAAIGNKP